jgi:predicted nucleic acid-binding Zn ribbon protein
MANIKKADRKPPLTKFFCVVCGESIPPDRLLKKSVTCSQAHGNILKNERRRRRDQERCRYCNRPSTPEERADFAAWRKTQPQAKKGRPFKVKPEETLAKGGGAVEDIRNGETADQNAGEEKSNVTVG